MLTILYKPRQQNTRIKKWKTIRQYEQQCDTIIMIDVDKLNSQVKLITVYWYIININSTPRPCANSVSLSIAWIWDIWLIIYTFPIVQDEAVTAATLLLHTQSLNSFTSTEHKSVLSGFVL